VKPAALSRTGLAQVWNRRLFRVLVWPECETSSSFVHWFWPRCETSGSFTNWFWTKCETSEPACFFFRHFRHLVKNILEKRFSVTNSVFFKERISKSPEIATTA
jgi:hypothetical protein